MKLLSKDRLRQLFFPLQVLLILAWLVNLAHTDSNFSVYVLCAFLGILACFAVRDSRPDKRARTAAFWGGAVFSLCTLLANYALFTRIDPQSALSPFTQTMQHLINAGLNLPGGFFLGRSVLLWMFSRLPLPCAPRPERTGAGAVRLFWAVFCGSGLVYSLFLFAVAWPGSLPPDSMHQIWQTWSGEYDASHPIFMTLMLRGILSVGYAIFGSANAAVAFCSFLQLLFFSACIAYGLVTLYQLGVPRVCLALCFCFYTLMCYNIAYSVTILKDTLFSLAALVIVVSLCRILRCIGRRPWLNYALFTLGGLGLCLWRTNGLVTLFITALLLLGCLWKHNRRLLLILAAVLILCALLTGTVGDALGARDADAPELMSLPLQQMARVVCDGKALTEEEAGLLGRIFHLDTLEQVYLPYLSDPVKNLVRDNDAAYFGAHLKEYICLWLKLGLKHPDSYAKAWIDQTRGYWNGGYDYFTLINTVADNDLGITRVVHIPLVSLLFYIYAALFQHIPLFQPLSAIGLSVWLAAACLLANRVRGRREWMLSVLPLAVIAGLLLGTPVFSEFRYAYPVILACPILLSVTLFSPEDAHEQR